MNYLELIVTIIKSCLNYYTLLPYEYFMTIKINRLKINQQLYNV